MKNFAKLLSPHFGQAHLPPSSGLRGIKVTTSFCCHCPLPWLTVASSSASRRHLLLNTFHQTLEIPSPAEMLLKFIVVMRPAVSSTVSALSITKPSHINSKWNLWMNVRMNWFCKPQKQPNAEIPSCCNCIFCTAIWHEFTKEKVGSK